MIAVRKPSHKRYAFSGLDEDTYTIYAEKYSKSKRYGIRGIYGNGGKDILLEASKSAISVKNFQLHYLAPLLGHQGMATNSTKVIKGAVLYHMLVKFLKIPIPVGEPGRFNLLKEK